MPLSVSLCIRLCLLSPLFIVHCVYVVWVLNWLLRECGLTAGLLFLSYGECRMFFYPCLICSFFLRYRYLCSMSIH